MVGPHAEFWLAVLVAAAPSSEVADQSVDCDAVLPAVEPVVAKVVVERRILLFDLLRRLQARIFAVRPGHNDEQVVFG